SLNGCTPFELALLLIDRKLLDLCQLERIPANQVILKPSLLKK
ncbi:IS30 family transposase, partial [Blautia obeum]